MNRESLATTAATGDAPYWSRSRMRLWKKGEQSGKYRRAARDPARLRRGGGAAQGGAGGGIACHTEGTAAFSRSSTTGAGDGGPGDQGPEGIYGRCATYLGTAADVVESRKGRRPGKVLCFRLFARGPDAILKKVGEEATEAVMAAKDGDRLRIVGENGRSVVSLSDHARTVRLAPRRRARGAASREGISGIDEKAARADKRRVKAERK